MVTDATRRWMREFAALRQAAGKQHPHDAAETARDLLDRALQLADAIREDAAACHQRCLALAAEARAARARADAVFENLPMAVVTTDLQGVIRSGNRAAGLLLARSHSLRDQLLLHYAEDRAGFAELLQRARASEEAVAATIRMRPRERAVLDVTVAVLIDARDVTRGSLLWFLRGAEVQRRAPNAASASRRTASVVAPNTRCDANVEA